MPVDWDPSTGFVLHHFTPEEVRAFEDAFGLKVKPQPDPDTLLAALDLVRVWRDGELRFFPASVRSDVAVP